MWKPEKSCCSSIRALHLVFILFWHRLLDILVLFLTYSGFASSFFLFRMMLAEGFSYIAFSMLSTVPSRSTFSRIFIIKVCKILSDLFCLYWHNHMNLCLCSFVWFITFIELHMFNHPAFKGESKFVMVYNISDACLYFFLSIFSVNLSELFIGLLFSFLLRLYLYCVLECYCLYGWYLGVLAPSPPLPFLLLLLRLVYY